MKKNAETTTGKASEIKAKSAKKATNVKRGKKAAVKSEKPQLTEKKKMFLNRFAIMTKLISASKYTQDEIADITFAETQKNKDTTKHITLLTDLRDSRNVKYSRFTDQNGKQRIAKLVVKKVKDASTKKLVEKEVMSWS